MAARLYYRQKVSMEGMCFVGSLFVLIGGTLFFLAVMLEYSYYDNTSAMGMDRAEFG